MRKHAADVVLMDDVGVLGGTTTGMRDRPDPANPMAGIWDPSRVNSFKWCSVSRFTSAGPKYGCSDLWRSSLATAMTVCTSAAQACFKSALTPLAAPMRSADLEIRVDNDSHTAWLAGVGQSRSKSKTMGYTMRKL